MVVSTLSCWSKRTLRLGFTYDNTSKCIIGVGESKGLGRTLLSTKLPNENWVGWCSTSWSRCSMGHRFRYVEESEQPESMLRGHGWERQGTGGEIWVAHGTERVQAMLDGWPPVLWGGGDLPWGGKTVILRDVHDPRACAT